VRVAVIIAAQLWGAATAWSIQTTVGGRQLDLDARLILREVIEENGSTKHERTREQLRLRAAVTFTDWLRFDSTTVGTHGGPTLKADRAAVYNLDDVFQDVSPALEFDEAYVDVRLASVDLRIGKQKVAWGKLDRTQPNDLINPLSYTDPFLQDETERKIGVPAVQASYYVPDAAFVPPESRVTLVWVPQYVPYRFSLASCQVQGGTSYCDVERWYPPAALPPTNFDVPGGITHINGQPNPPFRAPLAFRTENVPTPSLRLENTEVGLRYAGIAHGADFAFYYFHGFDVQPAFRLRAEAFGEPDPNNPNNPLGVKNLAGVTVAAPEFRGIDAWGADVAYALEHFTVRGEGAFIRGRPFTRDLRFLVTDPRQLVGPVLNALAVLADPRSGGHAAVELPPSVLRRDAVEWGVGADYTYEGYLLLLQVNQTDVLHNDVELLIKDIETRLVANLRKSFLSDSLKTQLVAVQAIESDYTLLRPRVTYAVTDHLSAEVGYLFIAGRARSVGGQFRRNDQGWVQLEYKL
jgi:hypothetical protein